MKQLGGILIGGGIVLAIYALVFMDTSVEVKYANGNNFGLPERVNNIGLMADKQNYLIGAGIAVVLGFILTFVQKSEPEVIQETVSENKKCPQCAETIKREAKICRYCNYKFTEEEMSQKLNPADTISYIKTKNQYILKNSTVIKMIEEDGLYCFDLKNSLIGSKRYCYDTRENAEQSINELSEAREFGKTGLVKMLNIL
jgi:hypothetical protein